MPATEDRTSSRIVVSRAGGRERGDGGAELPAVRAADCPLDQERLRGVGHLFPALQQTVQVSGIITRRTGTSGHGKYGILARQRGSGDTPLPPHRYQQHRPARAMPPMQRTGG